MNADSGVILGVVGQLGGRVAVYGLAGWSGEVFAFDGSGGVIALDVTTGTVTSRTRTLHPWWGAGVRTIINGD